MCPTRICLTNSRGKYKQKTLVTPNTHPIFSSMTKNGSHFDEKPMQMPPPPSSLYGSSKLAQGADACIKP